MADPAQALELIKAGDLSGLNLALEESPGLARARDAQGVSLICQAVYMGQRDAAERLARDRTDLDVFEASVLGNTARASELIDQDASLLNRYSPDGFHPLGYACFFGHRDLFDYLIAKGADVNAPANNPMKVAPLHSAVASADPHAALYLALVLLDKGADVNAVQQGGFTPLQAAAERGHAELIDLLLASGADKSLRNEEGNNAVGLACMAGYHHLAFKLAPGPVW